MVLALVRKEKEKDDKGKDKWTVDYRVRRFIRPVLVRDPLVTPLQCTPSEEAPEEKLEEKPEEKPEESPKPNLVMAAAKARTKGR